MILSANSGRIFWSAVEKWQEKRHGYSISAIAKISAIFILKFSGQRVVLSIRNLFINLKNHDFMERLVKRKNGASKGNAKLKPRKKKE